MMKNMFRIVSLVILIVSCLFLGSWPAAFGSSNDAHSLSQGFKGPINAVVLDKKSMVIVVPTNEGDKTVQKQIHACARGIRDRFFSPETPVITDKQALGRDLSSNSLIIYGTVSGNLWLAKHLADLPVRIETHQVVTDQPIRGTDLRFITAWANPFNPAKGMVIYTAQRANDVVNINAVSHGPDDYVVARGTEVLRSGNYIKQKDGWRFAPAEHHLPLKGAIADLDFFFRTVESVHPQPLAFVSPLDYLSLKRQSGARLEEAAKKEGNVPKSLLALTVAKAAAFFKDGHTRCDLTSDLLDQTNLAKRMLPFRFEYDYGNVIIGDAVGGLTSLKGCELLRINNVDFVKFVRPILDNLSGERLAFKIQSFVRNQRVCWAMVPLTQGSEVSITVLDNNGTTKSLAVGLISLEDYDAIPKKQRSRGKPETPHEFHHDGRTCYWQYNSFIYSEGEKRNIDSLFALLKDKKVENLIIDLRFNPGGNSKAGDYITDYLTSKPYCTFSKIDTKVSKQLLEKGRATGLKEVLKQRLGKGSETVLSELAGLVVTWSLSPQQPQDKPCRFNGRLFLLTSPGTFSSAAGFAAVVKDYQIGTIIGEETGGLRQCFGDQLRFSLPNSGIGFGVSYKRFYAPIPKPGDDLRGTVPDVIVDKEMLVRYLDSDDPVKSFALDYVRNLLSGT